MLNFKLELHFWKCLKFAHTLASSFFSTSRLDDKKQKKKREILKVVVVEFHWDASAFQWVIQRSRFIKTLKIGRFSRKNEQLRSRISRAKNPLLRLIFSLFFYFWNREHRRTAFFQTFLTTTPIDASLNLLFPNLFFCHFANRNSLFRECKRENLHFRFRLSMADLKKYLSSQTGTRKRILTLRTGSVRRCLAIAFTIAQTKV